MIAEYDTFEMNTAESQEESHLQELTVVVSLQDLDIDEEKISVKVGERSYAVHSLTQHGNQWIAKVGNGLTCAWGHPLCPRKAGCGQCHTKICPLYQKRTPRCPTL